MTVFKYLVLVGVAIGLFSCSRGNLYIDNAGTTLRKIDLDGQVFTLEGNGALIINAKQGKHQLKIMDENKKILKDTFFTLQKGGLINLGGTRYIKWKELYGDEIYRKEKMQSKMVEYESWVFTGDFTEYDSTQLYFEKDWNFDPDQPFPKDRIGWDLPTGEKYIIKSKVYRIENFVKEVKKN